MMRRIWRRWTRKRDEVTVTWYGSEMRGRVTYYENWRGAKFLRCPECRVPLDDDGWCSNGCARESRTFLRAARCPLCRHLYDPDWDCGCP